MQRFFDTNNNPRTKLSWTAPTENTDGSPITQALTYTLYIDIAGVLTPTISFPGTLNPDGTYGFPLGDVGAFEDDRTYTLALTATDADGDESDFSNSIEIRVAGSQVPNAPAALSLV